MQNNVYRALGILQALLYNQTVNFFLNMIKGGAE